MVEISKALENCVNFARWCINNQLEPLDVAELRTLVNQRADAWTAQNNQEIDWDEAEAEMERLDGEIDTKAAEMKITDMDWPGLYPTFTTPAGFRNSMLPETPEDADDEDE